MKKIFSVILLLSFLGIGVGYAYAENTTGTRTEAEMALAQNLHILEKGEAFSYPLPDDSVIECYAIEYEGSIDAFTEYNDYFLSKNGNLYSQTMHKLYKPRKANEYKKVDRVEISKDGKTLYLYDPLWEFSFRRHYRNIKIDTETGKYVMDAFQDNTAWYRKAKAQGYCRVLN